MPLDDVRVLDAATFAAAPFAATCLAEIGAEVIRIERPDIGEIALQGTLRHPGRDRRPGPTLAAHNETVCAGEPGLTREEVVHRSGPQRGVAGERREVERRRRGIGPFGVRLDRTSDSGRTACRRWSHNPAPGPNGGAASCC